MQTDKIYVAGHRGMVGGAIVRTLLAQGVAPENIIHRTHSELGLTNQAAVHANHTYPADFIYDNLMVQANVIQAAHSHGVQKLLFLGSSCIYPRMAQQPMVESALLTGTRLFHRFQFTIVLRLRKLRRRCALTVQNGLTLAYQDFVRQMGR